MKFVIIIVFAAILMCSVSQVFHGDKPTATFSGPITNHHHAPTQPPTSERCAPTAERNILVDDYNNRRESQATSHHRALRDKEGSGFPPMNLDVDRYNGNGLNQIFLVNTLHHLQTDGGTFSWNSALTTTTTTTDETVTTRRVSKTSTTHLPFIPVWTTTPPVPANKRYGYSEEEEAS